jgi:hypothetical protein
MGRFDYCVITKDIGYYSAERNNLAELKRVEIGGKRTAQLKACEENKAFKKFLDRKWRNNRIRGCQEEVKKRLDAEEEEQKQIVRRMTAIEEGKMLSEIEKSRGDKEKSLGQIDEKKSSKKLYVYGGIAGLVLVLGTIILLKK